MPYNSETETFYQAPATVVDSTPDGDTVQEGFDDRLTPAMTGVYTDLNLLKENGMIGVGIPATTTSRGIGRVATLADMEPGAVVENGPAVIDATGGVITSTPTAHAVPQANGQGKLDSWISSGSTGTSGLLRLTRTVSATDNGTAITPKGAYDSVKKLPYMLNWSAAVTMPTMTVAGVNPPIDGLLVGRAGRPGTMEVRCNGVAIAIDSGDASNSQFQLFVKKTDLISVSNATDIIQDAHVIPFM